MIPRTKTAAMPNRVHGRKLRMRRRPVSIEGTPAGVSSDSRQKRRSLRANVAWGLAGWLYAQNTDRPRAKRGAFKP